MKRKSPILVFLKAQASAFIGGMVDYGIMIFATEVLSIHYTISIIISGSIGAVVNFLINRKWTYNAQEASVKGQLAKFMVVVLGSIFLKSAGTYFFTNWLRIDYKIGRILTDIIVSLGFNYTLQTYWVFKNKKRVQ